MAYPSIHYGNFGDEKITSTAKINGMPLGIRMVLPDGREFVHARAGGTALEVGKLYQAATATIALTDTAYAKSLVPTSTIAVNATTIIFTNGATTAVTKDMFADGYLTTASTIGTGIGYVYKVKANNSAAAGATTTVTLYETDPVLVALAAGTTTLGISENKNAAIILSAANTIGAPLIGVPCNSAAASSYAWLQTKGPAAVFTGATVLLQRSPCTASTAAAGAVGPIAVAATSALLSTKESFQVVGIGLMGAGTAGYSLIDLSIT